MTVSATTTVLDVRKDLSARMTLPLDHIQLRFRGDDVLTDNVAMTPDNPVPYFIFNLHEPSEEELKEFKKDQHKKTRVTIETINWSALSKYVCVCVCNVCNVCERERELPCRISHARCRMTSIYSAQNLKSRFLIKLL